MTNQSESSPPANRSSDQDDKSSSGASSSSSTSSSSSSSANAAASLAPFHTLRSNTNRGRGRDGRSTNGGGGGVGGGGGSSSNADQPTNKTIYYQPTVHQFTCRGAFHLRNQNQQQQQQQQEQDKNNSQKNEDVGDSSSQSMHRSDNYDDDAEQQQQQQHNSDDTTNNNLEALIRDTFICNGIQSRLRHVADYPLAQSQEEAIRWFEGSDPIGVGGVEVHPAAHSHHDHHHQQHHGDDGGGGGGGGGSGYDTNDGHGSKKNKIDNENATIEDVDMMEPYVDVIGPDDDTTFSSYGTTQVNILTTQEVPVVIARNDNEVVVGSSSLMDDPFGGFGPIAHPAGMLNPFGSLFGGFFGGGIDDHHPWGQQHPAVGGDGGWGGVGGDANNKNGRAGGWMKGSSSRSVTSTTRVEKDDHGKRVVTTVTNTTIVDGDGKRKTETVTTQRHVDDGGRVETTKVVHGDDDNDDDGATPTTDQNHHPQVIPPSPFPFLRHPASMMRPGMVISSEEPTAPPEVAVIATDCLLGVSISDSASTDPDSFVVPSSSSSSSSSPGKSKSGWRKTEYLFKLGRFIPPFMIVGKYYKDEEEEERRRKEMQREYNDMRERLRKNRWDKRLRKDESTTTTNTDEKVEDDGRDHANSNPNNTELSNNISHVSSQTEYYLQRIYVQMVKNATMMKFLCGEMMKPDFPKKVKVGGEKVLDNIGPTVERTGRLMKDVWDMWTGWVFHDDEGGGGGGGRRGGGGGVGGASSRRG